MSTVYRVYGPSGEMRLSATAEGYDRLVDTVRLMARAGGPYAIRDERTGRTCAEFAGPSTYHPDRKESS